MSFDDLLGLLFLLFFVVLPTLKGLFSREDEVVVVEEPEAPGAEPDLPEPSAKEPPVVVKEAEPLREEPRVVVREAQTPPPPSAEEPTKGVEAPPKPRGQKPLLDFDRGAIVKGIIWHEVLSEPRAKRRWQPKR